EAHPLQVRRGGAAGQPVGQGEVGGAVVAVVGGHHPLEGLVGVLGQVVEAGEDDVPGGVGDQGVDLVGHLGGAVGGPALEEGGVPVEGEVERLPGLEGEVLEHLGRGRGLGRAGRAGRGEVGEGAGHAANGGADGAEVAFPGVVGVVAGGGEVDDVVSDGGL